MGDVAPDVIVVGSGPGGATLARRLAEVHGAHVLLLERGGSTAVMDVVGDAVRVTRRGTRGEYRRGVGLGGGAMINGGVLSWGHPADHDAWAVATNDTGWSWAAMESRYAALSADIPIVPEARRGAAGRVLREMCTARGARPVADLSRSIPDGDQVGGLAVRPAVGRWAAPATSVRIVTGAFVTGLVRDSGRVVGVRLADGSRYDATHVVLAAGVSGSLALLRGIGVQTCDVGDHPGFVVTFPEPNAGDVSQIDTGARLSSPWGSDDVQLVAIDSTEFPGRAAIVVALLAPRSRGGVDPATGVVEVGALDHDDDTRRLTWALDLVREGLADVGRIDGALVGRSGTALTERFAPTAGWWCDNVDGVWHINGGARIGRVADADGAVVGVPGLWVADASALPGVPRSNPQLAVMVLAEWVADAISRA